MGVWVAPAPSAEALLEAPPRDRPAGRAATALLVVSLLLAVLVAAGAGLGYRGSVILSGSMEPALSAGDLVVVQTIPAAQMRVGDIVSFGTPAGVTLTHRVTGLRASADGLAVTTRGDANGVSERWTTAPEARVGRVRATIPALGHVTRWTGSTSGRLIVLGAIGMLVAGLALRRIWER